MFDEVIEVDALDSADSVRLALMQRPELGVTFTKLRCWTLTHYSKCVFMDADTLVSRAGAVKMFESALKSYWVWGASLSGSLLAYEVTRSDGGHKVAGAPAGIFWQHSQVYWLHGNRPCFESSLRTVLKRYHKHILCKGFLTNF